MKYILLFFWLAISQVSADSIGLHVNSLRGLNREQCATLLHAYEGVKNPKVSFLWGTFDRTFPDGFDCAAAFLSTFKDEPHTIQVYADNSTCRRPPRFCEEGELAPWLRAGQYRSALEARNRRLLRAVRKRGRVIREYLDAHISANTQVSIVYSLEDDFSNKAFKIFKNTIDGELRTEWLKGRNPNGYNAKQYSIYGSNFIELHPLYAEFDAKPYAFSNDGFDADFGDGYRPLRDHLCYAAMFGNLRYFQENGDPRFVWFWWNNQGVTNKFIRPSRRSFLIRLKDIVLINKELLK